MPPILIGVFRSTTGFDTMSFAQRIFPDGSSPPVTPFVGDVFTTGRITQHGDVANRICVFGLGIRFARKDSMLCEGPQNCVAGECACSACAGRVMFFQTPETVMELSRHN
ncbi:hypothetical protein Fuma_04572 [Fuerstiella marisgermanici]|uniref:Uncharacterized protein n=1 Tax=Fuerstiella marisgermanici TaxID=1891926 RepID=A0A1P8WLK4_9PLAN|nr:hypothetical protein Fuma_04572 [Fuerstiella marisgermanici]